MSSIQSRLRRHASAWPGARLAAALLVCGLSLVAVISACQSTPQGGSQTAAPVDPVAHGQYLVSIMLCNDCHTPFKMGATGPEPDMTRMLSGHPAGTNLPTPPDPGNSPWGWMATLDNTAFAGPWGISYTANLTPDTTTGTGVWTEEQFSQSLRTGKHWGTGRAILPPMPWPWISKLTDEDMKAIYAYTRSIPPIQNEVPQPVSPDELAALRKGGK